MEIVVYLQGDKVGLQVLENALGLLRLQVWLIHNRAVIRGKPLSCDVSSLQAFIPCTCLLSNLRHRFKMPFVVNLQPLSSSMPSTL